MNISSLHNSITIDGNIKTISDFQDIKNTIDGVVATYKNIIININDSISVTSSVIGYFNKLVLKDNIKIQMNIKSPKLLELFDDLNLNATFNIRNI